MLYRDLSAAFAEDHPTATEESNVVPIESDMLYGTKAIANFMGTPLQRCRELIVAGAIPTFCMPGSTTRCARKSSLNATWEALEQKQARRESAELVTNWTCSFPASSFHERSLAA